MFSSKLSQRSFRPGLMMESLEQRELLSTVTFTLNQSKSFASLAGVTVALTPQAKNSLTANYTGNIKADVTSNSIKFTGGSASAVASGKWKPTPTKMTEYGAIIAGTIFTDLAGAALTISSTKALAVSSNGSFSSSGETFTATAGTLNIATATSKLISQSLKGVSATNAATSSSTLVKKNGILTLTIKILATLKVKLSGITLPVKLTGQVVATAKV